MKQNYPKTKQTKLNDFAEAKETEKRQSRSPEDQCTEAGKRNRIKELYLKGLNGNRISQKLKLSKSHTYRILNDLKRKEPEIELNKRNLTSLETFHTKPRGGGASNVHGQRLKVFVHHLSEEYKRHPNIMINEFAPGVNVQCSGKLIYIRSKGLKFWGENEVKAMHKSMKHWERILVRLEQKLNITIFKRGSPAFEITYHEWETSNSVVARDSENRQSHIWRVYHTEDGKLRFSIDWSNKLDSHETHHFRDNHLDSITFNKHINDILDNPQAPTFSEITKAIQSIAKTHEETAQGLKAITELLKLNSPRQPNIEIKDLKKTFYHE